MPGAASFKRVLDGELILDGVARRARSDGRAQLTLEGAFRSPHGRTAVRVRAQAMVHWGGGARRTEARPRALALGARGITVQMKKSGKDA